MFVQELAVALAAAEAAGKTPKLDEYGEVKRGDIVVGNVSDPKLLATMAVLDEQTGDLLLRWPTQPSPGSPDEPAAAAEIACVEVLKAIVRQEVQRVFPSLGFTAILFRRAAEGLIVVSEPKREEKARRGTMSVVISRISPRSALEGFLPDCGDPDCPVHGNTAVATEDFVDRVRDLLRPKCDNPKCPVCYPQA